MKKAIFLDRDGVINKLVYNLHTGEFESPHHENDLEIFPWALEALRELRGMGYLLFLVSNQPSYAKGKTSLDNLKAIHQRLHKYICDYGIEFTEYFYCYHHPEGIVEEYSGDCECRKPKPYFILQAKEKYQLDLAGSWLIGDRDLDILCGQSARVKTILIEQEDMKQRQEQIKPDYFANNLRDAVKIISNSAENKDMNEILSFRDLKIKIFADGADISLMKQAYQGGIVKGFTTNPTLMRKADVKEYEEFARAVLREIPDLPISFEVFSDDFPSMEKEAKKIAGWGKNVNVKIPITNTKQESTIPLIKRLSAQGLSLNITAILTIEQVEEVAGVLSPDSKTIISIFAGRIADTGRDPISYMKKAAEILRPNAGAQLLWASSRELLNIFQAQSCGCHIITVTDDILKKIILIGKDLKELSLDTVKMFYKDAQAAGYKITKD